MDPQLKAQMKDVTLIANSTGVNDDGELLYAASASALGRVIGKNVYVKNDRGESLFSSKQIVYPSSIDVRINSRVYLPGETTSADQGWVLAAIALRVGESGSSDHWKIWLGGVGGDGAAG